jgi:hypothetical protein
MHTSYVIPNVITKWHIQFLHILEVFYFLALQYLNFTNLSLHLLGPNFVHVSPHGIPKTHKNPYKFLPSITLSNLFSY